MSTIFGNLLISRKLMAAFGAVLAVIFASGAVIYDRLVVIEWAKNSRIHTADVLETLQNAMDALLDQETGVRGYLITGDEKFLEPYHKGASAYSIAFRSMRNLTSDNPTQQNRLDQLDGLATEWRSRLAQQEIALMAKPETRGDARALEASGAGKGAMDLIRAKVAEIERVERGLLASRDAVQAQAFRTAYTATIVGGAASLVIAGMMGLLLTRAIATPITRMTNIMTVLAQGNTAVAVPRLTRRDEIGAMAAALQIFKDRLIERERARAELAHFNRVTTMGQLTASIAHEVNQPLAAIVTNADAGLRWLAARPPNLEEVEHALGRIIKDGNRGSDVLGRVRALIKKVPVQKGLLAINGVLLDVIALTQSEVQGRQISLNTQLANDLPRIEGDRVQLQQVVLNLIMNAVEAMGGVTHSRRELLIGSEKDSSNRVLVTVRDSGPGLTAESFDHLFDPFYTTKRGGMGMGLSICQSIIEAHGGEMWAEPPHPSSGAVFRFAVPTHQESAGDHSIGRPSGTLV